MKERKRVLKKDRNIYLVENDIGGEFEEIRNRYPNIKRTKDYNDWIESNGFTSYKQFETYFNFKNREQAIDVFTNIWGEQVKDKIKSEIIKQNIVIYKLKI